MIKVFHKGAFLNIEIDKFLGYNQLKRNIIINYILQ